MFRLTTNASSAQTPGHSRGAARPWTSAALIGFILLTIAALVLVPIAVDRYTRPLHNEMRNVTEPSRALVTEIQLALALEGSILHDLFDTGDTVLIGRYREVRAREVSANERLARLIGRLGLTVQQRYDDLRQLETRWHAVVEKLLDPGFTGATMTDPLQAQLFEDVLVAVAQLDDGLERATRERRQQILDAERLQRRTGVILGVAAFAALGAVVSLGARLQDYAAATERARVALEEAMDSKSRLMRGISHDLKNPLNAIDGYAALLEAGIVGELAERQRQSVKRIRSGVQSLLVLIGDLLELSRAEGELRIASRAVDIREVVREAVDEHQAEARVAGHTIAVSFSDELGPAMADAARVRQVLGNLLSNAIKYTPPGGHIKVRAELRLRTDGASPRRMAIDVSDSGPGIPPDKLDIVFDEFTRLDDTGKPGAGLGLAIARRIARLIDGDITVTSEVGRGSRFTLWLTPQLPPS